MGFEFQNKLDILKHTTEKGQLKSITDTTAQHTVGSSYYDSKNNKTYVYAYNGLGAAGSINDPSYLVPQDSGQTGGNWTIEPVTDGAKRTYVCVPAAAIPSLYYGWAQVQGDVDVNASDTDVFTDEAWAANDELFITGGKPATVADDDAGITDTAFAIVQDSRASTDVGECTIYLVGREVIGST